MKIRNFFRKIKIGFARIMGNSIPFVSSKKLSGNCGENLFFNNLKNYLPYCKIKRNIIINTPDGNAEIDFLIMHGNKLFAIEVKNWKGKLVETQDGFFKSKEDRWTDEVHIDKLKSPFKQLNRAIYLLRQQIPTNSWINSIVFFMDEVEVASNNTEDIYFTDFDELIKYIKEEGKTSSLQDCLNFFNKCQSSDYIFSNKWDNSSYCLIDNNSLIFNVGDTKITKATIKCIEIKHHWSFDELLITTKNNISHKVMLENSIIKVNNNNVMEEYAFSKIDYIEIGDNNF